RARGARPRRPPSCAGCSRGRLPCGPTPTGTGRRLHAKPAGAGRSSWFPLPPRIADPCFCCVQRFVGLDTANGIVGNSERGRGVAPARKPLLAAPRGGTLGGGNGTCRPRGARRGTIG